MESQEYRIGRFLLQSFRQLLDGANPVTIGRKPLELLSVLARAEGKLVTKNELMAAVWPNAIVEDNALQSHIAGLRKLLGDEAERLCTVHGYGYRLTATPGAVIQSDTRLFGPVSQSPVSGLRTKRPYRIYVGIAAVVAAVSIGGLFLAVRDRQLAAAPPANGRVAVIPFEARGEQGIGRRFSDALLDEIVNQLSHNQIQVVSRSESQRLQHDTSGQALAKLGADLALVGTVQTDEKSIDVHVYLDDARERVSIWSDDFHGAITAPDALESIIATRVADIIHWAKIGRSGKYHLDPATLAAFVVARESTVGDKGTFEVNADYEKVVSAAPDFSWGHSGIGSTDALQAINLPESPQKAALRKGALAEAKRALDLEPHNGEAYLVRELVTPRLAWRDRETSLLQGAAADPHFEPIEMMEARLLWAVGRGRDALDWFEKAHDMDPLHNGESYSLAVSLASEGHTAESETLLQQMRKQWPNHPATRDAMFWTSIVSRSIRKAIDDLSDPSARPVYMNQDTANVWIQALEAQMTKDSHAKAKVVPVVRQASAEHLLGHGEALTLLTMLGDLDGAFAEAQLYQPTSPYPPPFLFIPPTAAMRADPRFMPLMQKLGLATYWHDTGNWADFCLEPGRRIDCQSE